MRAMILAVVLGAGSVAGAQGERDLGTMATAADRKACERGEAKACARAGAHYSAIAHFSNFESIGRADGTDWVEGMATRYHRRACRANVLASCRALAEDGQPPMCAESLGAEEVPEKVGKAREHFLSLLRTACRKGGLEACRELGERYLIGCWVARDAGRAVELVGKWAAPLRRGCQGGDVKACRGLGRLVEQLRSKVEDLEVGEGTGEDERAAARPLRVRRVTASSTLRPWKGYTFSAKHLVDGDLTTSWQPYDKRRGGVGEHVELRLGKRWVVTRVDIANGFQRKDRLGDLFRLNNRVRTADIGFAQGPAHRVELDGKRRGFQRVDLPPRLTDRVRVTVRGIHRGDKWNDLAISEIRVFGVEEGKRAGKPTDLRRWVAGLDEAVSGGLRAACGKGQVDACRDIASRATAGYAPEPERVRRVLPLVLPALTRACDKDPTKCEQLVELLMDAGRPEHAKRAARLLERGCRAGRSQSCAAIGCGEGSDRRLEGVKHDRRACEAGCRAGATVVCLDLAGMNRYPDAKSTYDHPMLKVAAASLHKECSDAGSCVAAAKEYEVTWDESKASDHVARFSAQTLYDKACTLKSGPACAKLGEILDVAHDGGPLAAGAFRRGCDLGHAASCDQLASLLGDGRGLPKDPAGAAAAAARAAKTYEAACQKGDGAACLDGPKRLRERGLKLLRNACRTDAAACRRLGEELKDPASLVEAFVHEARRCQAKPDGAGCNQMCADLGQLRGDEATPAPNEELPERLRPALRAASKVMDPKLVLEICLEWEIMDPCNCGCC